MAIRDDFFTALTDSAKWDVGVSINRTNPLPLDANSVFKSYEDMVAYTEGVLAYVGQPVAVVGETETTLYVLDQNKAPQEVGKATLGDGKSIDLDGEVLSLHGFKNATAGQQLRVVNKAAEGEPAKLEIEWFTPDTSTVEGLSSTVGALNDTVYGKEAVGEEGEEGYIPAVPGLTTRMTGAEGNIADLVQRIDNFGDIMNFAGVKTDVEFANVKAEDYEYGDVVIVKTGDKSTEYIVAKKLVGDVETKYWESLGDPHGVEALAGRVDTIEEDLNTATTGLKARMTAVEQNAQKGVNDAADAMAKANANADLINGHAQSIAGLQEKDTELQSAINDKVAQTDYNTKMQEISKELAEKAVKNEVTDALNGKVSTNTFDAHVAIAATKGELASEKEALEATIKATDDKAKANEQAIATHAAEYTALAVRVTANENAFAGKADKIAYETTAATVAQNVKSIAKNAGDISTLSGKVDAHAEASKDFESRITANTQAVAKIDTTIGEAAHDDVAATGLYLYADQVETRAKVYTDALANGQVNTNKGDIAGHETRIKALEGVGAQANVIEEIQLNGTKIDPANKVVNIQLGDLASKSKVAEADLKDDLVDKINLVSTKADADVVSTLIGEDTGKSARTIANEELAKQLIADNAQESLDTLKEIAEWIQQHPESASEMNDAIEGLKGIVGEAASGTVGEEDYKAATGLVKAIADEVVRATQAEAGIAQSVQGISEVLDNTQQIKAIGTNLELTEDGTLNNTYEHPVMTAEDAAFVKVGRDANGHAVIGAEIAASDITGLLDAVKDGEGTVVGTYDAVGSAAAAEASAKEYVNGLLAWESFDPQE